MIGHIRKSLSQIIRFLCFPLHVENRIFLSKGNQFLHISQKPLIFFLTFPVDPANGIVLAVGIVIALLGIADLVAAVNHGNPLGKQQHCKAG